MKLGRALAAHRRTGAADLRDPSHGPVTALMRRVGGRLLLLLWAMPLWVPQAALAQEAQVFVLGIRSVEGDDDVARNLTGAVRQEARGVTDWSVAPAEISLAQMSVAHGCDEPDAQCMAQIAEELGAARIIYGTVRRTGAGSEYDYALTLYNFNAEAAQIEDSLTDTIPKVQVDIDDLRARAERYIAQFAGQARFGSVRLTVNAPGATVYIDGERVGRTDDGGALLVEDVAEGSREIRIEAVDHEAYEGSIRIVPDEQTDFRANLVAGAGGGFGWVPGAALIAGGVVLAALGLRYSLKANEQFGERSDLQGLSDSAIDCLRTQLSGRSSIVTVDRANAIERCTSQGAGALGETVTVFQAGLLVGNGQVCDSPSGVVDGLKEFCDDRSKYRVLQWVFYGLGALAVGAGTVLLLRSSDGSDEEDQAARFQLTPWMAGRNEFGLDARLEF